MGYLRRWLRAAKREMLWFIYLPKELKLWLMLRETRVYTKENLVKWWPAYCPKCGWRGLSRDCAGGGSLGDSGDYDDVVCSACLKDREDWIPVEDDENYKEAENNEAAS